MIKLNRSQRMRKKRQMQKRRRFFSFLFIALAIFIIKKIDIPSRLSPNVAEASALNKSIELMSEDSPVNIALNKKRNEVLKTKIAKSLEEKKTQANIPDASGEKIAYLTFDDGPSANVTPQILDILKEKKVRATFFVIGQNAESYPALIKRTYNEGHALANHSYSHDYDKLYSSTDSFIQEMEETEKVLKNILGNDFTTRVIRFPGGSHGDKKNPFKKAAVENGYKYYDWNALNGDAEGKSFPKETLVKRLKETVQGQSELVILMHDMGGKQTTADALPEIIEYLKAEGYRFDVLK